MTRYWAIRTDQSHRPWIWSELQSGRLRQGWGTTPDLDLENLAEIVARGDRLEPIQREAWRGNRRLLPSQPDAMQVGDIAVLLHLPAHGVWSIARVSGGYRYEVSTQGNAWDGTPDYGHIREVDLLTDGRAIDPLRDGATDELRQSVRPMLRIWSIDGHGDEIERLLRRLV